MPAQKLGSHPPGQRREEDQHTAWRHSRSRVVKCRVSSVSFSSPSVSALAYPYSIYA